MKKLFFASILSAIVCPLFAQDCKVKVGESYAGGIVFYADTATCHGLVCASSDQATAVSWDIADSLCRALRSGGFSDWRLPSRNELNWMYLKLYKNRIGGFAEGFYWSASDARKYYAWDENFSTGLQYCSGKQTTGYVRAIRKF